MKRIGKRKSVIIVIIVLLMIWLAMGAVDYFGVSNFERPTFCLLDVENSYSDGGSGTYKGLGYSFDIMGNFMPEDEYPGVTSYTYYVFGNEVSAGIRD